MSHHSCTENPCTICGRMFDRHHDDFYVVEPKGQPEVRPFGVTVGEAPVVCRHPFAPGGTCCVCGAENVKPGCDVFIMNATAADKPEDLVVEARGAAEKGSVQ